MGNKGLLEMHGESTCRLGEIDYGCYYRKNSCRNFFWRKVGIGSRLHCLLGEAYKSLAISSIDAGGNDDNTLGGRWNCNEVAWVKGQMEV